MRVSTLLFFAFMSLNAFAYKDKADCDKKPSACSENSPPGNLRPGYEWKLGQVKDEPGKCWWTCDVREKNIDDAIDGVNRRAFFLKKNLRATLSLSITPTSLQKI